MCWAGRIKSWKDKFLFWRSAQLLMLKSVPSVLVLAQSALEKLLFLCTRIDLTARHLSVSPITSEHDSDSQCTEPLWSEFPSFFLNIIVHFCLLQLMEYRTKYYCQNMTADKTFCACEIETTSTAHGIVLSWAEQFVVCILIMYSRCVFVCISSLLTVK